MGTFWVSFATDNRPRMFSPPGVLASATPLWLELLKQIAPSVTRVAVIRNSDNPAGLAVFGAIQNAAQSLGLASSKITAKKIWTPPRRILD
jgi:hypothetical protein